MNGKIPLSLEGTSERGEEIPGPSWLSDRFAGDRIFSGEEKVITGDAPALVLHRQ